MAMNITIEIPNIQYFIRGYQPGQITVNDQTYRNSLIITPQKLIPDWQPQSLADLTTEALAALIAEKPELIILGSGLTHQFPPSELLVPIYQAHIGLEIMSTDAACRTYNLLADEGRKVLAALLIN
jgi:uncharacterized protein